MSLSGVYLPFGNNHELLINTIVQFGVWLHMEIIKTDCKYVIPNDSWVHPVDNQVISQNMSWDLESFINKVNKVPISFHTISQILIIL